MMNARWTSKPAPSRRGRRRASAPQRWRAQPRRARRPSQRRRRPPPGRQPRAAARTGGSTRPGQPRPPSRPRRHRAERGRDGRTPLSAVPQAPARRPVRPRPDPREEQARHVNGRDNGATRSLPDRGETPQPFSPRTPLPAPGRSAPRKIHPAGKGALARAHPNRRATLTAGLTAAPRTSAVRNRHRGTLPIRRGKAAPPPRDREQPPRNARTGPGQPPEREPRHCTPRICSKNTSLSGTGWLVALRSMSTDLTPSKSKGSEVSKHYSTNHQPPQNKSKPK